MAIHRNKIKRWIREIFRKSLLGDGFVVVVRGGFLEAGFKNISCDFGVVLDNFVKSSQDD